MRINSERLSALVIHYRVSVVAIVMAIVLSACINPSPEASESSAFLHLLSPSATIVLDDEAFEIWMGSTDPVEVSAREATEVGMARVERYTGQHSKFDWVTTISYPDATPNTALVSHTLTFKESATLGRSTPLAGHVANDTDHRLLYGPADETLYMMEDYINIPATDGYEKAGSMLYGGLPFNYAWAEAGGVGLGVLAIEAGTYGLPVSVDADRITLSATYQPDETLGQQVTFVEGETFETQTVFVTTSDTDFYQPLRRYAILFEAASSQDLLDRPIADNAPHPYWKTWGIGDGAGFFTKDQIRAILPELKELGIDRVLLDWGWFTAEQNWAVNPDIFDDDEDLADFIAELGTPDEDGYSFDVGLWYQPLQLDPGDDLASRFDDYVVEDSDLDIYVDDDDVHLLNPAHDEVRDYVTETLARFAKLGATYIYIDSQEAQLAIPPDYSEDDPLSSTRALDDLYSLMRDVADEHGLLLELCVDGRSQSVLNMSAADVTNLGDPKNDMAARAELIQLRALLGDRAQIAVYVDPFEDNPVSGSFGNIVGTGALLTTFFKSPDGLGRHEWDYWMGVVAEHQLHRGTTLDLYDIGFDYPEAHVTETDLLRAYAFFTRSDPTDVCLSSGCTEESLTEVEAATTEAYEGDLELRGLLPDTEYQLQQLAPGMEPFSAVSDSDGDIKLAAVSFDREIVYLVSLG